MVTWGQCSAGGCSSLVSSLLEGVVEVAGTDFAFAAVKDNGSVVTLVTQIATNRNRNDRNRSNGNDSNCNRNNSNNQIALFGAFRW